MRRRVIFGDGRTVIGALKDLLNILKIFMCDLFVAEFFIFLLQVEINKEEAHIMKIFIRDIFNYLIIVFLFTGWN